MSTLDKICKLTQQNSEFDAELRKRLNVASANSVVVVDERITQIYEYCIEKIICKQAEEFYADFPIKTIVPILKEDFIIFPKKRQFQRFLSCFISTN